MKLRAILIAASISLAVMLITGLDIWTDYQEAHERRMATATDVTRVVEKHIHETVNQAQVLIDRIGRTVLADGGTGRMADPARWSELKTFCEAITGCYAIGIIDPNGMSVANSTIVGPPGLDVSARAFFQVPQKTGKLFIGPALQTRLPGKPIVFHLSKAIFDSSNRFLGVVSVAMNTDHLTGFYESMNFATHPTVTVLRTDGDIVARNPEMATHVGKNNSKGPLFVEHLPKAPSGTYESVSVLDGRTRLAAYKSLPDLGLVIFAGIDKPVAYARWRDRTERTLKAVGMLLSLILVVLYVGYRSMAREFSLRTANRELTELSERDGLSGIANRRYFDAALKRDWARHQRNGTPLSLMMIDIDCFKKYNDSYGHQAGDVVLRQVAQALQSCAQRGIDQVARYGGEEFVLILDDDGDGARKVAERMREVVAALGIAHGASDAGPVVTVSIGLATATVTAGGLADADALTQHADRALYEAKARGRNQVQVGWPKEATLKLVAPSRTPAGDDAHSA